MTRMSCLCLLALLLVAILAITAFNIERQYHALYCTQCGSVSSSRTWNLGDLVLYRIMGTVMPTDLTTLHDLFLPFCQGHDWLDHHGFGVGLMSKMTYSGSSPAFCSDSIDALKEMRKQDAALVDSIVRHLFELNRRVDKRRYHFEYELRSMKDCRDLTRWRSWWADYMKAYTADNKHIERFMTIPP